MISVNGDPLEVCKDGKRERERENGRQIGRCGGEESQWTLMDRKIGVNDVCNGVWQGDRIRGKWCDVTGKIGQYGQTNK